MEPFQHIIEEITKKLKQKKIAIFFGAGLSFNSGLPIVTKLLEYLFEKMELSPQQAKLIVKSNLPFEAIIETILDESQLEDILDIFDDGKPNTNHILLASIAKAGCVNLICTTNFDTLLEQAFSNHGLIKDKDFIVYSTQQEIDNINWSSNQIKLVKIHGCVSHKAEMAITMAQVAGKIYSIARKKVITEIFSGNNHTTVLVLGYSCSDLFDITPHIEQLSSNLKEVIFIEHSPTSKHFKQENISIKNNKNPFKNFRSGSRIFINTDQFIHDLWQQFNFKQFEWVSFPETSWRIKIDAWGRKAEIESGESIKYQIAARLLYSIGEYEESINQNKKAEASAIKVGNVLGLSSAMGNMAMAYIHVSKPDQAEVLLQKSIPLCRAIENKQGEASQLQTLGMLQHKMGKNREALSTYQQALKLGEIMNDERAVSTTLGNMGNVYSRLFEYDNTIRAAEKGLIISRKLGMKQAEASQLGIIGMAYYNLGKKKEATEYLSNSISIYKLIGDPNGECNLLSLFLHTL